MSTRCAPKQPFPSTSTGHPSPSLPWTNECWLANLPSWFPYGSEWFFKKYKSAYSSAVSSLSSSNGVQSSPWPIRPQGTWMLQVSVLISSSPPLTHFLQTELCPFCPSNRLSQGRSQDQAGSKKGARAQNFRGYWLSGSECLLTLCTLKRLTRPGSSLCESHRPILSHCTRGSLPRPSQSWLRLLFRPPLGHNLPGMAIFHLQSAVFLHSSY